MQWANYTPAIPCTKEDIFSCVGPGWQDILSRLMDDLTTLGWDGDISQVKEKFGGLRFYINAGNDDIYERIAQAEEESTRTCEECGAPGNIKPLVKTRWYKCRCPSHEHAF